MKFSYILGTWHNDQVSERKLLSHSVYRTQYKKANIKPMVLYRNLLARHESLEIHGEKKTTNKFK